MSHSAGTLRRCFAANLATSPQMESIYKSHTIAQKVEKGGVLLMKDSQKSGESLSHTHSTISSGIGLTRVFVYG